MSPRKASQARFFSARFNPATSDEDRLALEYIDQLIAQGYNFKAIATDAILARAGYRPEMFSKPGSDVTIDRIEDILAAFAEDLIQRLGAMPRGNRHAATDDDDEETTSFSRNFAKGFLQRQKSGGNE